MTQDSDLPTRSAMLLADDAARNRQLLLDADMIAPDEPTPSFG